jgi:hypothetical protein
MRRVVLLALLALALPTAALANSVDYAGFATSLNPAVVSGSVSAGNVSITFSQLAINGGAAGAGTVQIAVTGTSCGAGCLNITGGTVTVWSASHTVLFAGTFSSGTATQTATSLTISGITTSGNTVAGVIKFNHVWVGSSDTIVAPEPGTLGLLGTGLIGLAGIVRRKIRG